MTHSFETRTCALCGSVHSYGYMASWTNAGSSDLDTRPPETRRSALFMSVHRCPDCGYCAADVSKSHPGAETAVKSPEYRRQLQDNSCDELTNSFSVPSDGRSFMRPLRGRGMGRDPGCMVM